MQNSGTWDQSDPHHAGRSGQKLTIVRAAKKLAAFSALACGLAGAVALGISIHSMPPGHAAFVFAQGQSASSIQLESLGSRTDYFGVGLKGARIEVMAPKGRMFAFERKGPKGQPPTMMYGTSSIIDLAPNARKAIEFTMVEKVGGKPEVQTVEFRAWSAKQEAVFVGEEMSGTPASNAMWMTYKHKSGKYTYTRQEGLEYRYALSAGQTEAVLPIPYEKLSASGIGVGGSDYESVARIKNTVFAPGPFKAILLPPMGMRFKFETGSYADKFEWASSGMGENSYEFALEDASGELHKMRVDLLSVPSVMKPAVASSKKPSP